MGRLIFFLSNDLLVYGYAPQSSSTTYFITLYTTIDQKAGKTSKFYLLLYQYINYYPICQSFF